MSNGNENEAENEKNRSKIQPRPRHGLKYTKYKMCFSVMMVICSEQHLSNILKLNS